MRKSGRVAVPSATPARETATIRPQFSGLVRLASDAALIGADVEARLNDSRVWLLPSAGRVVSATMSDQLRARDRLASDGWTFEPTMGRTPPGDVSASLDGFYLKAAWQARATLPRFPAGHFSLRDWPDLGSSAEFIEVLRIVHVLQRQVASAEELTRTCSMPIEHVSAYLWAFRASGILASREPRPRVAMPARASSGLWTRLASHFGLSRA